MTRKEYKYQKEWIKNNFPELFKATSKEDLPNLVELINIIAAYDYLFTQYKRI